MSGAHPRTRTSEALIVNGADSVSNDAGRVVDLDEHPDAARACGSSTRSGSSATFSQMIPLSSSAVAHSSARRRGEHLVEDPDDLAVVAEAVDWRGEPLVVAELGPSERRGQRRPLRLVLRGQVEPAAVGAPVRRVHRPEGVGRGCACWAAADRRAPAAVETDRPRRRRGSARSRRPVPRRCGRATRSAARMATSSASPVGWSP